MRQRSRFQNKRLKRAAVIILGITLVFLLLLVIAFKNFYTNIFTNKGSAGIVPTKIPEDKKVFTILLLGYGGGRHEGTYLTDTLMVARIDTKNKKVFLLSLPRDLWVKVPTRSRDDFHSKINAVYQMGLFPHEYPDVKVDKAGSQAGGDLVKQAVSRVTGIPIDYYLSLDFEGFIKAVDILGGVDIAVARSFDDEQYPLEGHEEDLCGVNPEDNSKLEELEKVATETPHLAYPCRYEKLHFDAGEQTMDGARALKYVRSRYSPQEAGDFSRGRRQQLFLNAVKEKVLSIGFIPKILPLLEELDDHVRTDVPPEVAKKLLNESNKANGYTTQDFVLTSDNFLQNSRSAANGFILISVDGEDDWTSVHKGLQNVMRGITPTPH